MLARRVVGVHAGSVLHLALMTTGAKLRTLAVVVGAHRARTVAAGCNAREAGQRSERQYSAPRSSPCTSGDDAAQSPAVCRLPCSRPGSPRSNLSPSPLQFPRSLQSSLALQYGAFSDGLFVQPQNTTKTPRRIALSAHRGAATCVGALRRSSAFGAIRFRRRSRRLHQSFRRDGGESRIGPLHCFSTVAARFEG